MPPSLSTNIALNPTRSRLIFRNLPPTLTPDSFRSTLTTPTGLSSAQVTDAKLVPKRRFGFVGYKSADEAQKVKDWFDGSFAFGGGKVKVEFVKDEVSDRARLLAPLSKRQWGTVLMEAGPQSGIRQKAEGDSPRRPD